MRLYDVVTLTVKIGANAQVFEGIQASGDPQGGKLLGAWYSDIGTLGQVLVLRGYESEAALVAERKRMLLEGNPFGCGESIIDVKTASYALFPFLPPIRTGERGGLYEVRTYRLKPGGLVPTLAGWEAAVPVARALTEHLVINMYALDGPAPTVEG